MTQPQHPWSVPVAVPEIPDAGVTLDLTADEAAREAVAKAAGVNTVTRLKASFHLVPDERGGVHVVGTVTATVAQTCVVTLEPVLNDVAEAVDLVFSPIQTDHEVRDLDLSNLEGAPEPLVGGVVDLGALATEFLILGIDPYPRKPDAVFEAPPEKQGDEGPFAGLAALKRDGGGSSG
jgi:hypothetical protein